jgi:hypothetical protein
MFYTLEEEKEEETKNGIETRPTIFSYKKGDKSTKEVALYRYSLFVSRVFFYSTFNNTP